MVPPILAEQESEPGARLILVHLISSHLACLPLDPALSTPTCFQTQPVVCFLHYAVSLLSLVSALLTLESKVPALRTTPLFSVCGGDVRVRWLVLGCG